MTESHPGSGLYAAMIPAGEVTDANLSTDWRCDSDTQTKSIGEIQLYDPSGQITDGESGALVAEATVTLYQVPNWLPDTPSERRNCRTVATRNGDDWSAEPAADIDLGVVVNPDLSGLENAPAISPTLNPQSTDAQGRYGWDVSQGCWYVVVQAPGYETRVSPVVGVPPEVTDLNLPLMPLHKRDGALFLPLVLRNR